MTAPPSAARLEPATHNGGRTSRTLSIPAVRIFTGTAIVTVQIVIGGVVTAGHARAYAPQRIGLRQASVGAGGAVEVGHHLDHGALDHRADAELDRLQGAFAGGDIDDVVAEELEEAGADLAADEGEQRHPRDAAEQREPGEAPERHSGDAGRQGDERADDRQHPREEDGGVAMALEPVVRPVQVAPVRVDDVVALEQLEAARNAVDVANLGLQLAQDVLARAERLFEAGVTTNIDVITAQDDLARADDNQIKALYKFNQARADLARAEGDVEAVYGR